MYMFFGISQRYTIYTIDIYEFYFEEYILGYLESSLPNQLWC